jgi:hypothetical protein
VIDGVPSAPRSSGNSQLIRLKNCSVNRTLRSATLTALFAQQPGGGENL